MKIPIHKIKKDKLVWMNNNFCKHNHTYLEHYNCYLQEQPDEQKIGHLDIEASNLDADFGLILSYCIKTHGKKEILKDVITKADLAKDLDKRVTQNLIRDMQKYDVLITYYGTGFDLPFIRARALINKIPFPHHGSIKHYDVYYTAKSKLKISSRRLENVCRVVLGTSQKTRVDGVHWINALRGEPKSLAYILDHNIKDVQDLEQVYNKMLDFTEGKTKSI